MYRPYNQPGLVILDANCFELMRDPEVRKRVDGDMRAAHWEIRATAMNAVEIMQHPSAAKREKLLRTIDAVTHGRDMLPWPNDLLRRVGEALRKGEPGFSVDPSGLEGVLEEPDKIDPATLSRIRRFLADIDSTFDRVHIKARPRVRDALKAAGAGNRWPDARTFLEEQWSRVEQLDTLIEGIWAALELPPPAPVNLVYKNPAFRLLLEGLGVAIYERDILGQQRSQVQLRDLMQLVYLGGTRRRLLATNDSGFHRVATTVLRGRYSGSRVITCNELLDS